MVYSTINNSESGNGSQNILETLERLRILATGWDKIFLDTQLRRYRIAKRDNKPFNFSSRDHHTLTQIATKQGGEV